ncbi:putative nucleosome assembly protein Nap1 [Trichodelitschia bisporula]|uniref:Putative nucleosome assembly protein Nap1 n=1 Tax=Trichodelitschia bisporula TaxID=703511 RepID=A0A6G1I8E2_9PEZI|nr:putative nucleosome assembly protein Nap1 [Trichodelitschia bisporula]
MAEPIRNKKLDLTAPTPQNTPLNAAPISSRAQQPGLSSLKEEDFDKAAAAGLLASNPALINMMQAKLGSLIGRPSGYIEALPPQVRKRVTGLKGVQKEHARLEAEFQEEVLELEKKYFKKFTPLYEKRARIVNGLEEPTEDEVSAGQQKDEEGEPKIQELEDTPAEDASELAPKGVPEFWLSSMKNQISLAEMITDRDEEALQHLADIRMEYLDKPGFKLIFEFTENEFFTNKTLTKTYFYQEENGYGGDFIYDHAEGQSIDWKSGKDLTVRIENKKQRNKNTKQTRIVKKTVPCESFFNFFAPPKPPAGEDDTSSDIEERLELDYQLGEDIKEKLIPRAIDWFTGEALQFEQFDELDEGEFEDEDDEEDDFSEDRDEDEEESDEEDDPSKPKQEAAECKQS